MSQFAQSFRESTPIIGDEENGEVHRNANSGDEGPNAYSTILPNKEGKAYSMEEIFRVWQKSEPKILGSVNKKIGPNNQEYMLELPKPIYHLELQLKNKTFSPWSQKNGDIDAQFSRLSTNEDTPLEKVAASNQSVDEQGPNFGTDTVPYKNDLITNSLSNEWFYIDPSGIEQGPFSSVVMQEWFMSGYLALNLNVKRKSDPVYQTLQQVCESQNNFTSPFGTALPGFFPLNNVVTPSQEIKPSVSVQNQLDHFLDEKPTEVESPGMNMNSLASQPNFFGNNILGQSENSFSNPVSAGAAFSGPQQSSFENVASRVNYGNNLAGGLPQVNQLNNLLRQQSGGLLPQNNGAWNLDDPSALMGSGPENRSAVPQPLSDISLQQHMPLFFPRVQPQSRVGSPFAPGPSIAPEDELREIEVRKQVDQLNQVSDDNLLHQLHNSVVTNLLDENINDQSIGSGKEAEPTVPESPKPTTDEDARRSGLYSSVNDLRLNQVNVESETPRNEEILKGTVLEKEKTRTQSKTPVTSKDKPSLSSKKLSKEGSAPVEKHTVSPLAPPKTAYAPWANAAADAQERQSKPSMTLKDIQNLEVERAKEQRHVEGAIRKEQLLKESREKVPTPRNNLPKTSSWAANNNTRTPVVTKTLGEIQKEEAEAREKSRGSTSAPSSQASSFAAALASSKPREDNSWTFVAPKKAVQRKPSQAQVSTTAASTSKSIASPQYLRAVSASVPVSKNVNANAIVEDFLSWARSSMTNLYPTVSKDDLLDVFVTLPLNQDSSLIIAESIYGSSTTMDGRRFTNEFLKRRQKLEQQIGPQDARFWSLAIQSSADKVPTVDEEGWSTNWKAGKKGKKA